MHCHVCHEETLPDAFVCRFCGASLPGAATGTTERLSSGMVVTCPKCDHFMEPGFLTNPHPAHAAWWVAGFSDDTYWPANKHGEQRTAMPITLYRCGHCGYIEAYAQPIA